MLARARALAQPEERRRRRGVLASSGVTHFLHDGFSDGIYLLLPIWQAEFGLSLAATGVLKSCYSGALAAFQVPAGLLAERFGERALLAIGTVVTGLGVVVAGLAFVAMRALGVGDSPAKVRVGARATFRGGWGITDRQGFGALAAIGIVDSAVRTGFLTFLPFLLQAKGADVSTIGLALGLAFAGGASGKFLCGVLAERAGILRTVIVTELVTALGILLLLPMPLLAALAILPLLGAALNGTSSVLYASVAEFVAAERRSRGFALFYTLGIGSSAVAPFVFGVISDLASVTTALVVVALLRDGDAAAHVAAPGTSGERGAAVSAHMTAGIASGTGPRPRCRVRKRPIMSAAATASATARPIQTPSPLSPAPKARPSARLPPIAQ